MIEQEEYARRRKQLMRILGEDSICIVPAAPERLRSNDIHHPYRQDSDFEYLTGFSEPGAVLALSPGRGRERGKAILFCRERNPERETWDGPCAGTKGAVAQFGMDEAFPIDDIDDILPATMEGRSRVYYHLGREPDFDARVIRWVNRGRAKSSTSARTPHELSALGHVLHEMRLYKSQSELRVMRHAARVAVDAHVRAMQVVTPGMNEHEVEAELVYTIHRHGAVPSYAPIVGGGKNACILHYQTNNAPLKDGDLLLIDAGAEVECYASDITRTFPVNGRYSPEQRALYEIVLAAQHAAISEMRVEHPYIASHDAAVRTITGGLVKLGLLKGRVATLIRDGSYRQFYMHKTGHWIGLDVHDVGSYRLDDKYRKLEAGMILTVEPGIYISPADQSVPKQWRGIGIRIEDDVVVTRSEPEVITHRVPTDPDAIEALMANR